MTKQDTQILGDEGAALGRAIAPSSRSGTRRREPVILIHRSAPPPVASGDASSPDWDVPPTIGELAVRLVARFTLPRMKMLPRDQEG